MVTRRTLIASSLAAACASPGRADLQLEGRTILSHSAMLSGADADGRCFAAVRTCTYPDAGLAWLWCMLLTPNGFWQFAANDAPWRAGDPDGRHTVRARGATAQIDRTGDANAPTSAAVAAGFASQPALGEADAPVRRGTVSIAAQFTPAAGHAGLLPGRSEAFGRARFACSIDGTDITFEGPAQFHEQSQTEPRFMTPFAFASLWSDDLYATLLQTPQGSGGYLIEDGRPRQVRAVTADLGTDLALGFEDAGAAVRLPLEAARRYRVPVYSEMWRGRFVRGRLGGRAVNGFLNSWRL